MKGLTAALGCAAIAPAAAALAPSPRQPRPAFPYLGRKYSAPVACEGNIVIEAFAGSARYSHRRWVIEEPIKTFPMTAEQSKQLAARLRELPGQVVIRYGSTPRAES